MRDARHRHPVVIGPMCKHDGGARSLETIEYIVIHDAEGSSAQGVAAYGATTSNVVSWHVTCDDDVLIRCLSDRMIAWAAPPCNSNGLQIELCGYARWRRRDWYRHQSTLKRAAWQVARWCKEYGIPARWLTDAELKSGNHVGITTHAQVNRVYGKSDHTDPGAGFPSRYFMYLVRRRVKWLG